VTEYEVGGDCVEIKDLTRCEDRKNHHRIALYIILALSAIAVFVCIYMKKMERRLHLANLATIKRDALQEESMRKSRAKTMPTKGSGQRLTQGVVSSMPSKSPRPQTTVKLYGDSNGKQGPLSTRNINNSNSTYGTQPQLTQSLEDRQFFHP